MQIIEIQTGAPQSYRGYFPHVRYSAVPGYRIRALRKELGLEMGYTEIAPVILKFDDGSERIIIEPGDFPDGYPDETGEQTWVRRRLIPQLILKGVENINISENRKKEILAVP